MEPIREDETEFLSSLEERIVKAVELVATLRKENAALEVKWKASVAEMDGVEDTLSEVRQESAELRKEIETLKAERKQVKSRIEKLLGQMDLLGAG